MKGTLLSLIACITLGSCIHREATPSLPLGDASSRKPSAEYDIDDDYKFSMNEIKPDAEDLSFLELETILQQNKFRKIADLLRYLSTAKPRYMEHYTLGFNSKSLHGSSKTSPRAIVYGKRGNFIITFNGERSQTAFNKLEVTEFSHDTNQFTFREIEFSESDIVGNGYKISKPNGDDGKCLICHSAQRPIWSGYPRWPGFYGGDDDNLTKISPLDVSRALEEKIPASVRNDWNTFIKSKRTSERYRYLPQQAPSLFAPSLGIAPNADLSVTMSRLNALRIGQSLRNAGGAGQPRYAFLFALTCGSYRDLYRGVSAGYKVISFESEADLRVKHPNLPFSLQWNLFDTGRKSFGDDKYVLQAPVDERAKEQIRQLSEEMGIDFRLAQERWGPNLERAFGEPVGRELSSLVLVTQQLFPKLDTDLWTMSHPKGIYDFNNGINNNVPLLYAVETLLFQEKERSELIRQRKIDMNGYCDGLRSKMPPSLQ
jgi:hypothetical protein